MGIKYFFKWFQENHAECISVLNNDFTYLNPPLVLLMDLNGVIHNCAQKVYGYGNYSYGYKEQTNKNVYALICYTIDKMLKRLSPCELVICIDGVAPTSKQIQQRQRRFLAAHSKIKTEFDFDIQECKFDSNAISPGTEFLHYLGKYLDSYIKTKQQSDEQWKKTLVIFSNEKVEGEGEHKLLNYIRKFGKHGLNYCIYGVDADLIMLSMSVLATGVIDNIYVLRDKFKSTEYLLINIKMFIDELLENKSWKENFDRERFVYDFIFLCFLVGNDFVPNIPSIEIMTNGLEFIFNSYFKYQHHIINLQPMHFDFRALLPILEDLETLEQALYNQKVNDSRYFKDELLETCSSSDLPKTVDIAKYRFTYTNTHFPNNQNVGRMYLEGLQWILLYYTKGVPDWLWSYRYNYSPNLTSIVAWMRNSVEKKYYYFGKIFTVNNAISPFHQLLSILPKESANLLPESFRNAFENELKPFFPDKLVVDLSGKRNDWEGIVLLPPLNNVVVSQAYFKYRQLSPNKSLLRDIKGKTFKYEKGNVSFIA